MNVNWTPRGLERLNGIVREIAFGDGISTALKWHGDILTQRNNLQTSLFPGVSSRR